MSRAPRSEAARRSWGDDDAGCTILHVDMDAFFASVELLDHPELRGKPVIVGGQHRGVVSAASYEARAFGVHSAMPVTRARMLCPQGVFLPGRHQRYAEVSRQVMTVLGDVTPVMEPVSIDEAFLDVAGAVRRMGSPVAIARWIRAEVRARTGVTASVGAAGTKHVAKLASTHAKPDGLMLVPVAATLPFLHSLPVGALWGVGEKTRAVLERRGLETVADIAATPLAALHRMLGVAAGQKLHELAWGIDDRRVVPGRVEKSVGTETTFPEDITDRTILETVLLDQAHQCAARLRADAVLAATVSIKVRMADFTTLTRSRTLPAPTDLAHDLVTAVRDLLGAVSIPPDGVRLLGVRAERLVDARSTGVQGALDEDPQRARAERAMDGVRARFGPGVLRPASLMDTTRGSAFPGARGDIS
ncbi:DNA polymerase IV [Georgenia yuyongxinii]|uniref:DNA polymerase IV n=1 Tax=Georgenia yuyongxinii TaxID=2589797 RepID=A0A5B8C4S6_9MICO|nr:DNA polymerase IV [Georgenia yuyongxinii]QDC24325.1 DNA polymerase IV [Georgenia yuyongxinii]